MNNQLSIKNPYDNNFNIAQISTFNKSDIKSAVIPENQEMLKINTHLRITISKNGAKIQYNPDTIKFKKDEDKEVFQREVASFFINNGFIFNALIEEIPIYVCGTELDASDSEFFFQANEDILGEEESKVLFEIASNIVINSFDSIMDVHPELFE